MIRYITFISLLLCTFAAFAQHTFSIVAVDTATGQVGSAGASCIDTTNSYNINRINEVIPGKGAINAQAAWDFTNLANAKKRMQAGDSPQQIITWLTNNDSQNNPQRMQYGIVDIYNNQPRAAAFSGTKALDYKNHNVGRNYAVQGNVLIGQRVLDSIESRFVKAQGPFTDRLMAALHGAKFAGADKRCLNEGVSSRSAFIRVAKPGDQGSSYYLDLSIPWRPYGVEPITELQKKYDIWKQTTGISSKDDLNFSRPFIAYNKTDGIIFLEFSNAIPDRIELVSITGKVLPVAGCDHSKILKLDLSSLSNGFYFLNYYMNTTKTDVYKISLIR